MIILGFMQNMRVRDPGRVMAVIESVPPVEQYAFRLGLIRRFLFAGGKIGKELRLAFGPLCEKITWDEASSEIGERPSKICAPVKAHARFAIDYHHPDIVITFGRIADQALIGAWFGKQIIAPHPASRFLDTRERLRRAAHELEELILAQPEA
jgi:hypothetical protein